jgi:hypothetical protein
MGTFRVRGSSLERARKDRDQPTHGRPGVGNPGGRLWGGNKAGTQGRQLAQSEISLRGREAGQRTRHYRLSLVDRPGLMPQQHRTESHDSRPDQLLISSAMRSLTGRDD